MSAKRLSAYLNDNLIDETLGLDLATRAGAEHNGTKLGTFLELLSWELEDDRDSLKGLMRKLGVHRRDAGVMLARVRGAGSRPASTVDELESLQLRVDGKLAMWNALRSDVGDRVAGFNFDEMIRRAEGQAQVVRTKLAVTT